MNYNFCISDFEGPLDLLLHMVKESKMDIYNINISEIIDQYLDYIHSLKEQNIDITSEYLIMACDLVHLKSKRIINKIDEEDEFAETIISSEEDLKNKIIEYEKYKEITEELNSLQSVRNEIYTRDPELLEEYYKTVNYDYNMDINKLVEAYNSFLNRQITKKPINTKVLLKEININDKIKQIRQKLLIQDKIRFEDIIEENNRTNIIISFLSILEMTKNKEISISQNNIFSSIFIEKRV